MIWLDRRRIQGCCMFENSNPIDLRPFPLDSADLMAPAQRKSIIWSAYRFLYLLVPAHKKSSQQVVTSLSDIRHGSRIQQGFSYSRGSSACRIWIILLVLASFCAHHCLTASGVYSVSRCLTGSWSQCPLEQVRDRTPFGGDSICQSVITDLWCVEKT
jgi:hypothetical protein